MLCTLPLNPYLISNRFAWNLNLHTFVPHFSGDVAQLVEQRTENPCVGGSIPSITTPQPPNGGFYIYRWINWQF